MIADNQTRTQQKVNSGFQEASPSNPCPLCGKPDWCYLSDNLEVVVCGRTDPNQAPSDWKYIGDSTDGRLKFVKKTENNHNDAWEQHCKKKKQKPKPKPIEAIEIAKPLPSWENSHKVGNKTIYKYSEAQWIERKPSTKPGKKWDYYYHHLDSQGKDQRGKGSNHWLPYGWRSFYKKDQTLEEKRELKKQWVLAVEGQKDVETTIALGLCAVDYKFLNDDINLLTLGNVVKGVVILPDNDKPGFDLVKRIEKKVPDNLEVLIVDPKLIYPEIREKDDLTDIYGAMGQDQEKLVKAIYEAIERAKQRHNEEVRQAEENQVKGWTIDAPNEIDQPKPSSLAKPFLLQFVRERYGDRLALNELGDQIELDGQEYLIEEAHLLLADRHWINNTKETCGDIFAHIARENEYDPIKNYLDAVHDNEEKISIDDLSSRYLGTSDKIFDIFVKKMLIGAVARIYESGCKVDTALILKGDQGIGKSTFFKVLAGGWFDDSLGDCKDKDDLLKLYRCWIQEWSEIDKIFSKKKASDVKAFLSSSTDTFRSPYARSTKTHQRRSIIVGSTNNDEFLNDPTGSRRFWVIPVEQKINLSLLEKERDRIWASAVEAYKRGEQWWLTSEEEKLSRTNNETYQEVDVWIEIIEPWLSKQWIEDGFSTHEVLEKAIGLETEKMDKRSQMRVSNILTELGYRKDRKMKNGKRQYLWFPYVPAQPAQPDDERLGRDENQSYQGDVQPAQPAQPKSENYNSSSSSSTANTADPKVSNKGCEVGQPEQEDSCNADVEGSTDPDQPSAQPSQNEENTQRKPSRTPKYEVGQWVEAQYYLPKNYKAFQKIEKILSIEEHTVFYRTQKGSLRESNILRVLSKTETIEKGLS